MSLKPVLKTIVAFGKRHSTKLLAGGAIVSELFALYFVHRKAPEVRKRLDELPGNPSLMDKAKVVVPLYLPAIGMLFLSGGCVIGCCAVGEMQTAAMATLAATSQAQLSQYEKKASEMLGEDKAKELKKAVAEEHMKSVPAFDQRNIIATDHGCDIYFDTWSGRYFTSSKVWVEQAVARFNNSLTGVNMWGTVNDWYRELDIPTIDAGGYAGWHIDYKLSIDYTQKETPDGRPCMVIVYYKEPKLYDERLPEIEQHW